MMLKGAQRAGGAQLARHLLNTRDNEHVEIYELRGFVSDTLEGAFKEAGAIARGTRCKQFLFSLSLSPPETENVPIAVFEKAITDIEKRVGLSDQPRAIVFHEKEGRRHAHCVWSRIDLETITAINLPHFKMKLRDMSRELFLEHGWQMPYGLMNSAERNPLNFTLVEWQQAKRVKQDPRVIKQILQDCWKRSDSQSAFAHALKERGFWLAKGDRRGHVAVDWRGEVYAISRWVGVKAKDVRSRFGDPSSLPTVERAKAAIAALHTDNLREFIATEEGRYAATDAALSRKRTEMTNAHRLARRELATNQKARSVDESRERASRLPTGLKALWFRLTGQYREISKENERQHKACQKRDRLEREALIADQLHERRKLQHEFRLHRHRHTLTIKKLHREVGRYLPSSDYHVERPNAPSRARRQYPRRSFH